MPLTWPGWAYPAALRSGFPDARKFIFVWLERRGGSVDDFAFPSRVEPDGHLSTRQYARLVDEWVTAIGLRPEEYGRIHFVGQRQR